MNQEIQNMAADINNGHIIDLHNSREVAQISQHAQSEGWYSARFEDRMAAVLRHSMAAGVYRRTSQPTPPPGNIIQSLKARV
ncbi:hypothetical protein [Aeromonas intestinalis]